MPMWLSIGSTRASEMCEPVRRIFSRRWAGSFGGGV